jgi:hypothetical protein
MTYDVGNPGTGFGQARKCKICLTNQIYLLQLWLVKNIKKTFFWGQNDLFTNFSCRNTISFFLGLKRKI